MSDPDPDPTDLIGESYRIEGIDAAQCRTIFLEWLLKLPPGLDQRAAVAAMLARHADAPPDHPMSALLRAALQPPPGPGGRRGGAAARRPAPGAGRKPPGR